MSDVGGYYHSQALQAEAAAALAAAHGHGLDHGGHMDHAGIGDGDGGGDHGEDGDKPLTSRFRGVCWNKKNRRWQSAINSSGKYIYLGSFQDEEEAARMFDRAAVRLRGTRAKLNFAITDYTDANGELLDDPRMNSILNKADASTAAAGSGKPGAGRGGGGLDQHFQGAGSGAMPLTSGAGPGHGGGSVPGSQDHGMGRGRGSGGGPGTGNRGVTSGTAPGAVMAQRVSTAPPPGGFTVPANAFKGRSINAMEVPLPAGCTLEATVPGEDDAFGILYLEPGPQRHLGAVIWDGFASQDLGVFDTDRDARTACNSALRIVLQYKNQNALLLQSLAESMLPSSGAPAPAPPTLPGTSHQSHHNPQHRRPSSPSGYGMLQETVALDTLPSGAHALDTTTLGPVAVLSTAPAPLGQHGFTTPGGIATASNLKPQGGQSSSGGQRTYQELFTYMLNYPKGPGKGLTVGAGVGPGGNAGLAEEEVGMSMQAAMAAAAANPDLAGLLAQMNGGTGTGDILPNLTGLPISLLGRVSNTGGALAVAPGGTLVSATTLPGVAPLTQRESDDGSEPGAKRAKLGAPAGSMGLGMALPLAGGNVAVSNVPSDFSQMKSLSNLSVQDVMKQLQAEGRM